MEYLLKVLSNKDHGKRVQQVLLCSINLISEQGNKVGILMSRHSESNLGILGGVIGIVLGVLGFIWSSISSIVNLRIEYGLVTSVIAVVLGFLAMVGANIDRRDRLTGGVFMIVIAIIGFAEIGGLYAISSLLVLLAGVLALVEHYR